MKNNISLFDLLEKYDDHISIENKLEIVEFLEEHEYETIEDSYGNTISLDEFVGIYEKYDGCHIDNIEFNNDEYFDDYFEDDID